MRALVDVGIFYTMCDGKSFVIAHFYNRTVGIYQSCLLYTSISRCPNIRWCLGISLWWWMKPSPLPRCSRLWNRRL